MLPATKKAAAPPPPDTAPKTVADQVKNILHRKQIRELSIRKIELAAQRKEIETEIDSIDENLKILCGRYGISKAVDEDFSLTYYASDRSSIRGDLLLGLGVSPQVISEATKVTTSYILRVSAPSEKEK